MSTLQEDARQMGFRAAAVRTKHVNLDALTAAERKENLDGIAKLSMLKGMQKQALQ